MMFHVLFVCVIPDVHAIEDVIFGEHFDDKWNLLLWRIGMDPQLQFDLITIPRRNVHTVLALTFLTKICCLFNVNGK